MREAWQTFKGFLPVVQFVVVFAVLFGIALGTALAVGWTE